MANLRQDLDTALERAVGDQVDVQLIPDEVLAARRSSSDAAADHVVVQIVGDTDLADPRPALRELATALKL
jgi:hypothetical protein